MRGLRALVCLAAAGTVVLVLLVAHGWGAGALGHPRSRGRGRHAHDDGGDDDNADDGGGGPADGADPPGVVLGAAAADDPAWAWARDIWLVYTWVNGSDPAYRVARAAHGGAEAIGTSRDRDSGELRYALRSMTRHLPWARGPVVLVTPGGQAPAWLNLSHPRVRVVPQESLFPDATDLPTFNTNAIEQHLWRLPGVSPLFVHLNDDYFFGAPVAPAHLFTAGRGSRLFFEPSRIRGGRGQAAALEAKRTKVWLAATLNTHAILTDAYGTATRRYLKHAPFVYQVAALRRMHERWPDALKRTSTHRFRHWQDAITPLLHAYLLVHEGAALGLDVQVAPAAEMRRATGFLVVTDATTADHDLLRRIRAGTAPRMFTLNDGFSKQEQARLVESTLAAAFPHPCELERTDS
jgi:hypothetical protein